MEERYEYHESGSGPGDRPPPRRRGTNVVPISSGVLLIIVGIALALLETYILQAATWIATIGFVMIGLGLAALVLTTVMTYFGSD